MSGYVLDTSALLAHFRQEAGWDRVQTILEDDSAEVHLSALSIAEMARCLFNLGSNQDDARSTALAYANLATSVIPVDTAIAVRAFEFGTCCSGRLPLADALIAACASVIGAVLVHRDAHFDSIADTLLHKEMLT